MNDQSYYEHYAAEGKKAYNIDRLLNDPANRTRLETTVAAVPADVRSVLDVGCGGGVFVNLLAERRNIPAVGLERTEALIQVASETYPQQFIAGSADTLPFTAKSVDLVSALEVIEHLPYGVYEATLAEMARVARRWILVSVPYRENRNFVPCPYCGCRFNPFYHMHTFDEDTMQTLFPGFRAVSLQKIHIDKRPVLYNTVYRWYFRNSLPPSAVCPSCGFRREGVLARESADEHPERASGGGLKATLQRLYLHDFPLPRISRYRWILGLYERTK